MQKLFILVGVAFWLSSSLAYGSRFVNQRQALTDIKAGVVQTYENRGELEEGEVLALSEIHVLALKSYFASCETTSDNPHVECTLEQVWEKMSEANPKFDRSSGFYDYLGSLIQQANLIE